MATKKSRQEAEPREAAVFRLYEVQPGKNVFAFGECLMEGDQVELDSFFAAPLVSHGVLAVVEDQTEPAAEG